MDIRKWLNEQYDAFGTIHDEEIVALEEYSRILPEEIHSIIEKEFNLFNRNKQKYSKDQLIEKYGNWLENCKKAYAYSDNEVSKAIESNFFVNVDHLIHRLLENYCLREFHQWALNEIEGKAQKDKKKEPPNNAKSLFCHLINELKIHSFTEQDSAISYTKRVCEIYNINHSTRVEKGFYQQPTKEIAKNLVETIFPLIDESTKTRIEEYLIKNGYIQSNIYG